MTERTVATGPAGTGDRERAWRFLDLDRVARRYDEVVCLGRGCQPAYQIRRLLGTTAAHVFDWLITTDRGLVTLIEQNLDGFFTRERLHVGRHGTVADVLSDTRFIHEFPAGSDLAVQHAAHAPRIAMLVERWRRLLASRRRVLFVRVHMDDDGDPGAAALRLQAAIAARAPRLRLTILYLTIADTAAPVARPWHATGILDRRLRLPADGDWRGDDAAWEGLLRDALAAPVSWRRSPRGVAVLRHPPPTTGEP